jgi:hypothetical protein
MFRVLYLLPEHQIKEALSPLLLLRVLLHMLAPLAEL